MKPHAQGQLDGLCGVYSWVNAVRLVANISYQEATGLFHRIFSAVEQRKSLSGIIKNGLTSRDMAFVFKEVIEQEYLIKWGKPYPKGFEVGLGPYWEKLQGFLAQGRNRAVILVLESWDWGHWTVIQRATENSLYLFDSNGFKRLSRRRCTTKRLSTPRPVLIHPRMTYFLWRKE